MLFLLYLMGCSQVVRQWTLTPLCVGSNPTIPVLSKITQTIFFPMTGVIFWNETIQETTFPFLFVTKSKNGKTGTVTFLFFYPNLLTKHLGTESPIEKMSISWNQKVFTTKDIEVLFWKGKPYLIKTIFLFQNLREWFEFLTLLTKFSKETGFLFSQTKKDPVEKS